eukprot:snap_masked-scaffold_16-processed-gene-1.28-mRNA-1 protein AED:1.00 eAED:1.00 QI:0/0/0/0/1/1/2/0/3701
MIREKERKPNELNGQFLRANSRGIIPDPTVGHTLTSVGSLAYLIGGLKVKNQVDSETILDGHSKLQTFDMDNILSVKMSTCLWEKAEVKFSERIPVGRFYHTALNYANQSILIFAGFETGYSRLNDLWSLDILSLKWDEIEPRGASPNPRGLHSMSCSGTKLYLFGGYGGRRSCVSQSIDDLNDLWMFSMTTFEWVEIKQTTGPRPEKRCSHASEIVKQILIIIGGSNGTRMFNDVKVLNLETLNWTDHSKLEVSVWHHLCFKVDSVPSEKIFFFGGCEQETFEVPQQSPAEKMLDLQPLYIRKELNLSEKFNDMVVYVLDGETLSLSLFTIAFPKGELFDCFHARKYTAGVLDPVTSSVLIFGGFRDKILNLCLYVDAGLIAGPPYRVFSILPNSGPVCGGQKVMITGSNFAWVKGKKLYMRVICHNFDFEVECQGICISRTEIVLTMPDIRKLRTGPKISDKARAHPEEDLVTKLDQTSNLTDVKLRVAFDNDSFTSTYVSYTYYALTSPSHSYAFGPAIYSGATVGVQASFIVVSKSKYGKKQIYGGDEYEVRVYSIHEPKTQKPSRHHEKIETYIDDINNGYYYTFLRLDKPGKYEIEVWFTGKSVDNEGKEYTYCASQQVKNSPFTVQYRRKGKRWGNKVTDRSLVLLLEDQIESMNRFLDVTEIQLSSVFIEKNIRKLKSDLQYFVLVHDQLVTAERQQDIKLREIESMFEICAFIHINDTTKAEESFDDLKDLALLYDLVYSKEHNFFKNLVAASRSALKEYAKEFISEVKAEAAALLSDARSLYASFPSQPFFDSTENFEETAALNESLLSELKILRSRFVLSKKHLGTFELYIPEEHEIKSCLEDCEQDIDVMNEFREKSAELYDYIEDTKGFLVENADISLIHSNLDSKKQVLSGYSDLLSRYKAYPTVVDLANITLARLEVISFLMSPTWNSDHTIKAFSSDDDLQEEVGLALGSSEKCINDLLNLKLECCHGEAKLVYAESRVEENILERMIELNNFMQEIVLPTCSTIISNSEESPFFAEVLGYLGCNLSEVACFPGVLVEKYRVSFSHDGKKYFGLDVVTEIFSYIQEISLVYAALSPMLKDVQQYVIISDNVYQQVCSELLDKIDSFALIRNQKSTFTATSMKKLVEELYDVSKSLKMLQQQASYQLERAIQTFPKLGFIQLESLKKFLWAETGTSACLHLARIGLFPGVEQVLFQRKEGADVVKVYELRGAQNEVCSFDEPLLVDKDRAAFAKCISQAYEGRLLQNFLLCKSKYAVLPPVQWLFKPCIAKNEQSFEFYHICIFVAWQCSFFQSICESKKIILSHLSETCKTTRAEVLSKFKKNIRVSAYSCRIIEALCLLDVFNYLIQELLSKEACSKVWEVIPHFLYWFHKGSSKIIVTYLKYAHQYKLSWKLDYDFVEIVLGESTKKVQFQMVQQMHNSQVVCCQVGLNFSSQVSKSCFGSLSLLLGMDIFSRLIQGAAEVSSSVLATYNTSSCAPNSIYIIDTRLGVPNMEHLYSLVHEEARTVRREFHEVKLPFISSPIKTLENPNLMIVLTTALANQKFLSLGSMFFPLAENEMRLEVFFLSVGLGEAVIPDLIDKVSLVLRNCATPFAVSLSTFIRFFLISLEQLPQFNHEASEEDIVKQISELLVEFEDFSRNDNSRAMANPEVSSFKAVDSFEEAVTQAASAQDAWVDEVLLKRVHIAVKSLNYFHVILLLGPPVSGKTLLTKLIAGTLLQLRLVNEVKPILHMSILETCNLLLDSRDSSGVTCWHCSCNSQCIQDILFQFCATDLPCRSCILTETCTIEDVSPSILGQVMILNCSCDDTLVDRLISSFVVKLNFEEQLLVVISEALDKVLNLLLVSLSDFDQFLVTPLNNSLYLVSALKLLRLIFRKYDEFLNEANISNIIVFTCYWATRFMCLPTAAPQIKNLFLSAGLITERLGCDAAGVYLDVSTEGIEFSDIEKLRKNQQRSFMNSPSVVYVEEHAQVRYWLNESLKLDDDILVHGPPSVGKTFEIEFALNKLNKDISRKSLYDVGICLQQGDNEKEILFVEDVSAFIEKNQISHLRNLKAFLESPRVLSKQTRVLQEMRSPKESIPDLNYARILHHSIILSFDAFSEKSISSILTKVLNPVYLSKCFSLYESFYPLLNRVLTPFYGVYFSNWVPFRLLLYVAQSLYSIEVLEEGNFASSLQIILFISSTICSKKSVCEKLQERLHRAFKSELALEPSSQAIEAMDRLSVEVGTQFKRHVGNMQELDCVSRVNKVFGDICKCLNWVYLKAGIFFFPFKVLFLKILLFLSSERVVLSVMVDDTGYYSLIFQLTMKGLMLKGFQQFFIGEKPFPEILYEIGKLVAKGMRKICLVFLFGVTAETMNILSLLFSQHLEHVLPIGTLDEILLTFKETLPSTEKSATREKIRLSFIKILLSSVKVVMLHVGCNKASRTFHGYTVLKKRVTEFKYSETDVPLIQGYLPRVITFIFPMNDENRTGVHISNNFMEKIPDLEPFFGTVVKSSSFVSLWIHYYYEKIKEMNDETEKYKKAIAVVDSQRKEQSKLKDYLSEVSKEKVKAEELSQLKSTQHEKLLAKFEIENTILQELIQNTEKLNFELNQLHDSLQLKMDPVEEKLNNIRAGVVELDKPGILNLLKESKVGKSKLLLLKGYYVLCSTSGLLKEKVKIKSTNVKTLNWGDISSYFLSSFKEWFEILLNPTRLAECKSITLKKLEIVMEYMVRSLEVPFEGKESTNLKKLCGVLGLIAETLKIGIENECETKELKLKKKSFEKQKQIEILQTKKVEQFQENLKIAESFSQEAFSNFQNLEQEERNSRGQLKFAEKLLVLLGEQEGMDKELNEPLIWKQKGQLLAATCDIEVKQKTAMQCIVAMGLLVQDRKNTVSDIVSKLKNLSWVDESEKEWLHNGQLFFEKSSNWPMSEVKLSQFSDWGPYISLAEALAGQSKILCMHDYFSQLSLCDQRFGSHSLLDFKKLSVQDKIRELMAVDSGIVILDISLFSDIAFLSNLVLSLVSMTSTSRESATNQKVCKTIILYSQYRKYMSSPFVETIAINLNRSAMRELLGSALFKPGVKEDCYFHFQSRKTFLMNQITLERNNLRDLVILSTSSSGEANGELIEEIEACRTTIDTYILEQQKLTKFENGNLVVFDSLGLFLDYCSILFEVSHCCFPEFGVPSLSIFSFLNSIEKHFYPTENEQTDKIFEYIKQNDLQKDIICGGMYDKFCDEAFNGDNLAELKELVTERINQLTDPLLEKLSCNIWRDMVSRLPMLERNIFNFIFSCNLGENSNIAHIFYSMNKNVQQELLVPAYLCSWVTKSMFHKLTILDNEMKQLNGTSQYFSPFLDNFVTDADVWKKVKWKTSHLKLTEETEAQLCEISDDILPSFTESERFLFLYAMESPAAIFYMERLTLSLLPNTHKYLAKEFTKTLRISLANAIALSSPKYPTFLVHLDGIDPEVSLSLMSQEKGVGIYKSFFAPSKKENILAHFINSAKAGDWVVAAVEGTSSLLFFLSLFERTKDKVATINVDWRVFLIFSSSIYQNPFFFSTAEFAPFSWILNNSPFFALETSIMDTERYILSQLSTNKPEVLYLTNIFSTVFYGYCNFFPEVDFHLQKHNLVENFISTLKLFQTANFSVKIMMAKMHNLFFGTTSLSEQDFLSLLKWGNEENEAGLNKPYHPQAQMTRFLKVSREVSKNV